MRNCSPRISQPCPHRVSARRSALPPRTTPSAMSASSTLAASFSYTPLKTASRFSRTLPAISPIIPKS